LHRYVERFSELQPPAPHLLAQCLAIDELSDEVVSPVNLPDLVNGEDIRVVEGRGRLRLLPYPLKGMFSGVGG
jgi:hypothetical protein